MSDLLQATDGDRAFLRRQWDDLTGGLAVGREEGEALRARVGALLGGGCFYHNLHHVADLLLSRISSAIWCGDSPDSPVESTQYPAQNIWRVPATRSKIADSDSR
jgi:hypothetical protein